jgi:hypothetical protein
LAAGAAKPSLADRKNVPGHQISDAPFASHLDADHVPPAQAARAALEDRPDLTGRPFGATVSLLARHEELPAVEGETPSEDPTIEAGGDEGAAARATV